MDPETPIQTNADGPKPIQIAILAAAMTMGVIGAIGNIIVLILFYFDRKNIYVAHYFIISMAVSDLLENIFGSPLTAYYRLFLKSEDPACRIMYGLRAFLSLICLFNITVTGIDRYWGIVHAVSYRVYASAKTAKSMSFASDFIG